MLLPPLRGDLQRLALGDGAALPEEVPRRAGRWLVTCVVRLSQAEGVAGAGKSCWYSNNKLNHPPNLITIFMGINHEK